MKTQEPKSNANMAALLRSAAGYERTLAIPPGLTHAEAVEYVAKWLGAGETLAQFMEHR